MSEMSGDEAAGVAFPASEGGHRSTSALGQAVVADALARVDPAGALDARRETNWRAGYLTHFRRLIEAGLTSKQAAVSVARDGLASLHRQMRVVGRDGSETGLETLLTTPARCVLTAVTVAGTGAAERELSLPYRGERLCGSASFCSATPPATRTPIHASAIPYSAAHSTSTGIRTTAGSERVNTAASTTGMTATTVPKRLPNVPASR